MDDGNYDPETDVHRTEYDADGDDSLSYSIVRAIAAVSDEEPESVQPLFDGVDPDALERLFESFRSGEPGRSAGWVRFPVAEFTVRVDADGTITICRTGADADDATG